MVYLCFSIKRIDCINSCYDMYYEFNKNNSIKKKEIINDESSPIIGINVVEKILWCPHWTLFYIITQI